MQQRSLGEAHQRISYQRGVPTERMLKFFAYDHLREDLKSVSKPFAQLAEQVVALVPAGPERTVSLRKLLETKDAAVRAVGIGAPPLSR